MNKKGWMRILEATIAVILVSGVLITVYTRQPDRGLDAGEYVYSFQKEVLDEISLNSSYRRAILDYGSGEADKEYSWLENYVESKLFSNFDWKIKICPLDLSDPPKPVICKLEEGDFNTPQEFKDTLQKDMFVEERVISASLNDFRPKKVRLFIWEVKD